MQPFRPIAQWSYVHLTNVASDCSRVVAVDSLVTEHSFQSSDILSCVEPPTRWAQRKSLILLTIDLQDVADEKISISDEGGFGFHATGSLHDYRDQRQEYSFALELFKPLNASDSKCKVTPRDVSCTLIKRSRGRYWPRLLKKKGTQQSWLTVDWSKWLDEEKDGVKWNDLADRRWQWWKDEHEEDGL